MCNSVIYIYLYHTVTGGHIVIVTRFKHLQTVDDYRGRLEPLMDKLEAEGKWKKVERKILVDKKGILWKYKIC